MVFNDDNGSNVKDPGKDVMASPLHQVTPITLLPPSHKQFAASMTQADDDVEQVAPAPNAKPIAAMATKPVDKKTTDKSGSFAYAGNSWFNQQRQAWFDAFYGPGAAQKVIDAHVDIAYLYFRKDAASGIRPVERIMLGEKDAGSWIYDRGSELQSTKATHAEIALMVILVGQKKWENVALNGSPEFVQEATAALARAGIGVRSINGRAVERTIDKDDAQSTPPAAATDLPTTEQPQTSDDDAVAVPPWVRRPRGPGM